MRWYYLLAALGLAASGCGGKGPTIAPVSGLVTMNGQPLANATVTFQPMRSQDKDPGPGSYGKTDLNGRFTLRLVGSDRPGAVVGKHRVAITSGAAADTTNDRAPATKEGIPARYNTKSRLETEVGPGGTEEANFPLKSP
jgi:hypothetical protein